MDRLKFVVVAGLFALGAFAADEASAQTYAFQVWNPTTLQWSSDGITHLTGPVMIAAPGAPVPCNADVTVVVRRGFAFVRTATFSGSATCATIAVSNLAWGGSDPVPYAGVNPPFTSAPILSPTLWTVSFRDVSINAGGGACAMVNGTITGVLDEGDQTGSPPATPVGNRFVFKTNLGTCGFQTSVTVAPYALVATIPLRVVPANC